LSVCVDAGLSVVDEIPAGMIGIIVNDEVVARAVPAPAGREVPIPRSNLKREPTREPEAVRTEIKAFDVIAVGRAEVFEAAVRIRMRDDVALVIGAIVAVPVIIVNVGNAVDAVAGAMIDFRLGGWRAVRGSFGNVAAVGVNVVMAFAAGVFAGALRVCGRSKRNSCCECQC